MHLSALTKALIIIGSPLFLGFPGGLHGKEFASKAGDQVQTLVFTFTFHFHDWRKKWKPTPVLLPGESHGQKNLVGNSEWGRKESDTTERLSLPFTKMSVYLEQLRVPPILLHLA